jgi:hypothetical protein
LYHQACAHQPYLNKSQVLEFNKGNRKAQGICNPTKIYNKSKKNPNSCILL